VASGERAGTAQEQFAFEVTAPGAYRLEVLRFGTVSTAAVPYQLTLRLADCLDVFDCPFTDAPVCTADTLQCVAEPETCAGDDAADAAPGDDGPALARVIAAPTAVDAPTEVTAAVCSAPVEESDWYTVTRPAGSFALDLRWTPTAADDAVVADLWDPTGESLGATTKLDAGRGFAPVTSAGGQYLVRVRRAPTGVATALPYQLGLRVAECEDDYGCTAGAPVCQADRTCGAGPSECVGDAPADSGASDDGPRGGRDLSGAEGVAVTLSGAICDTPQAEYDWYQVTVGDGHGDGLALAWSGAADVDLVVFDDQQQALRLGSWRNPEAIDLAFLPAGTYFLRVALYVLTPEMPSTTDAVAYTITATRSVPPPAASTPPAAQRRTPRRCTGARATLAPARASSSPPGPAPSATPATRQTTAPPRPARTRRSRATRRPAPAPSRARATPTAPPCPARSASPPACARRRAPRTSTAASTPRPPRGPSASRGTTRRARRPPASSRSDIGVMVGRPRPNYRGRLSVIPATCVLARRLLLPGS
jgi:hypothetical protein